MMSEGYAGDTLETASEGFLLELAQELYSIPEITRLDEYSHFHCQLQAMRARSTQFVRQRFVLELAVLLRLQRYDTRLGVPPCEMPRSDGLGGLVEVSSIPEEWR